METDTRKHLLAIPSRERLERVLSYVLDEEEFLSPYGIRSLSKFHEEHPFGLHLDGQYHHVHYTPGESDSWLFGGNSNWRGPIWLPLNYLFLESLEKYHYYYGDTFKMECPAGSGNWMNLLEISQHIETRIAKLFTRDESGARAVYDGDPKYKDDPHFKDLVLFYEYFHADSGKGIGASHQTGWTALIAEILDSLEN